MSLLEDIRCTCLSDMYYLRRKFPLLLATSLITPLLYLVAFGWGLGSGVTMTYDGRSYPYIAYMIPGVIALTSLTAAFNTVSNKLLIQRRFYESFDEMMLCPVSKTSIIIGKSILGIVKALLCAFIMLVLGCCLTDAIVISPMLILSVIASSTAFALLGVAAGMLMRDLAWMNTFNSFVILPMTFLCGTMFPIDKMPEAIGWIVQVLPLSPASSCIRAAALGTEFPWLSFAVILVWIVVFYFLARYGLHESN